MGNVTVTKHSDVSHSALRSAPNGKSSATIKHQKLVGKLPPLHVIKDSSVQTDANHSVYIIRTGVFSVSSLVILASAVYFGICYAIICSNYVQSLVVYSHYVKDELPFQDLQKMGLPEAKNVHIITEDGLLLRGWHLMPPGGDVLHANSLPDEERDVYFDHALAHSSRIVLYFHGNSHTRAQPFRLRTIKQMAVYLDAHVIAVDYRGFADSEGHPSEDGTHLDARAVVHYVDNVVRRHNPYASGYLASVADVANNTVVSDSMFDQFMGLLESHREYLAANMAQVSPVEQASAAGDENSGTGGDSESTGLAATNATMSSQPHLFIYGHSLGAAISTALAVELSNLKPGALTGLMLDCPFTTLPDAIRTHPLTAPFRIFPAVFSIM
jgi:pimeloyl-ACP methyl ester carboxylesterase